LFGIVHSQAKYSLSNMVITQSNEWKLVQCESYSNLVFRLMKTFTPGYSLFLVSSNDSTFVPLWKKDPSAQIATFMLYWHFIANKERVYTHTTTTDKIFSHNDEAMEEDNSQTTMTPQTPARKKRLYKRCNEIQELVHNTPLSDLRRSNPLPSVEPLQLMAARRRISRSPRNLRSGCQRGPRKENHMH
jgi:hypothetical protein